MKEATFRSLGVLKPASGSPARIPAELSTYRPEGRNPKGNYSLMNTRANALPRILN